MYLVLIGVLLFFLLVFLFYNTYKFKRIKRRKIIKKMKVDEHIVEIIDEFKKELNNNFELKMMQNKMRMVYIIKNILFIIFIIILIFGPVLYAILKFALNVNIPLINGNHMISILYVLFIIIYICVLWYTRILYFSRYQKNKNILKNYIYNDFLKRIDFDILWYKKQELMNSEKTIEMIGTNINCNENYKKASFNKIQIDEKSNENNLLSNFFYSKNVSFEDFISGIYKEKYILSMSDFKEYIIFNDDKRYTKNFLNSEGIFCTIKINKKIKNDIRITSNKKNSIFMDRQYMITTMPNEFYRNFIIVAKNGYQISEKISKKSIEIIEEFYNNSKMNFDISIKNDEIFFRFHTIDSMEFNTWKNIIDDLMLKEYANIILFITRLSEEINNNWKNEEV